MNCFLEEQNHSKFLPAIIDFDLLTTLREDNAISSDLKAYSYLCDIYFLLEIKWHVFVIGSMKNKEKHNERIKYMWNFYIK